MQEAKTEAGLDRRDRLDQDFHDHPLLIEAFAERLARSLPVRARAFTAQACPSARSSAATPTAWKRTATAAAVALRAGLADWDFAFQSQGFTEDKWLGPTVESRIDDTPPRGSARWCSPHRLRLRPCRDPLRRGRHVPQLRPRARYRASPPRSLNDSPTFVRALAAVAGQAMPGSDRRRRDLGTLGRLLSVKPRHRLHSDRAAKGAWAA